MIQDLKIFFPGKLVFGKGSLEQLPGEITALTLAPDNERKEAQVTLRAV